VVTNGSKTYSSSKSWLLPSTAENASNLARRKGPTPLNSSVDTRRKKMIASFHGSPTSLKHIKNLKVKP
jgi:hypothetical protein